MGESGTDKYIKEICDIKHQSMEARIKALEESIEEILQPGNGHIAVLKSDLEKRIASQDAKVNGLIMTIVTTLAGTAIAIGGEFIKKFVK